MGFNIMNRLTGLFLLVATIDGHIVVGRNGRTYSKLEKCVASDDHFLSAGEEKNIFEINKGIKGLVEGDVIPPENPNTRNTISNWRRHWPSVRIPIAYDDEIHLEAVGSIELARQEYKLRTCVEFIDRTDERNYIRYAALGGCFSSVGMVGLAQTISIGVGCERLGTVCHEMMHAIGIYHEQSRADRDDYVEIQWDRITEGYENNFNKYDWEFTNARGLPYDYNSIMHYSDSGFSTTGEPTIVTRDPAFQDVIGQRTTFSRSDSTKINRMYNCSDTVLFSYNCNYDDETECGYVQDWETDNVDWLRYDVGNAPDGFSSQAPSYDATLGKDGRGTYMALDSRSGSSGEIAKMRSKRFLTKSPNQCLQFSYYIKNSDISVSSLKVHIATINNITGEVLDEGDPIVEFTGNYNMWQIQRMTIQAPGQYKLIFVGTTSGSSDEIIALDDVSVIDKKCDDDYVEIPDYQNYLDTYAVDESFLTPVMVTEQGYNFRLKVYPNGRTGSSAGYMSMSFGIVQGPNDNDLDWPFCNKYIRMSLVNKDAEPLYQQNRFLEYVTSQDVGGAVWNKPTSDESLGYIGYYNYMRKSDLTDPKKNFMKHGSILLSVLIQDMNWFNNDVCIGNFTNNTLSSSRNHESANFKEDEVHYSELYGLHNGGEHGEHGHNDHIIPPFDKLRTTTETTTVTTTIAITTSGSRPDGLVPLGKVVAVTIGLSAFILVVMCSVLCCVVKSHRKNITKAIANQHFTIHTNTPIPPACPENKISL